MRNLLLAVICFSVLSFSFHAQALVDVRVGAGIGFPDPKAMNSNLTSGQIINLLILPKFGLDVAITPFPVDLSLGVRYEEHGLQYGGTTSAVNAEARVRVSRFALLGYLDVVPGNFVFGPVVTVGLYHSPYLRARGGSINYDFNEGKTTSVTGGVQIGTHIFNTLFIGSEVGYQSFMVKEFKGPSGTAPFDMDLSGAYVTGFFGIRI